MVNNCSGSESLQTGGCMVGSSAKDASLCVDSWSSPRNMSLGKTLVLVEKNIGSSGRGEQQDALVPDLCPRLHSLTLRFSDGIVL